MGASTSPHRWQGTLPGPAYGTKRGPLRSRHEQESSGRSLDVVHQMYAESHDPGLEAELIRRHRPLAIDLSSRLSHRGEATDDLHQVATIALLRALRNFDPYRGARFATYAVPTILGPLKRHFRDQGWAVRPPRRVHDTYLVVHSLSMTSKRTWGGPRA